MERLTEHRRNLLIAIAGAISMLSRASHWRLVIDNALGPVCEAMRSDRVLLVRFEGEGTATWSCRVAAWMPPGSIGASPEVYDELARFPLVGDGHDLMHHYHAYVSGNAITLQYGPALSETDRWTMSMTRAHSALRMPVFAHGRLWGALGLDSTSRQRLWVEAELTAIWGLASVLGAMIERDGD